MSIVQVDNPESVFDCDCCENVRAIVTIHTGTGDDIDLCRACAMDLVHKLKTKITDDLLGIKE